MLIDDIELRYIQHLIPSLLTKKLQRLGLKRIGELIAISPEHFSQIVGVGRKATSMLTRLQADILMHPDKYRRCVETEPRKQLSFRIKPKIDNNWPKNIETEEDASQNLEEKSKEKIEEACKIELGYVLERIPSILVEKFRKMRINTIGDVLNIPLSSFLNCKGVGVKAFRSLQLLQSDIRNNPKEYCDEATKLRNSLLSGKMVDNTAVRAITLPQDYSSDDTFITSFAKVFEAYYQASKAKKSKSERNYEIMMRLFGIKRPKANMVDVGYYFNITREAVRVIRNRELVILGALLAGENSGRTHYKCDDRIVERFLAVLEIVAKSSFWPEPFASELVGITNDHVAKSEFVPLFYRILDYDSIQWKGSVVYYRVSSYYLEQAKTILNVVYEIVSHAYKPLDEFQVLALLRKNIKKWKVDQSDVASILGQIPQYEKLEIGGMRRYQARCDGDIPTRTIALRVLYESTEHKPLHFREIARNVKKKLAENGVRKKLSVEGVKAQLIQSEDAIPIRNSGCWALREWGVDDSTIVERMIRTLNEKAEPLAIKEIYEILSKSDKSISRSTVSGLLAMSKDRFAKEKRGKYGLREWFGSFDMESESQLRNKYDNQMIMELIIEIFEKSGVVSMKKQKLREKLNDKGVSFPESSFYVKLKSFPIIQHISEDRYSIRLVDQPRDMMSVSSPSQGTKADRIEADAISYMKTMGGVVLLKVLVKILERDNYKRPQIYKALRESNLITSKTENRNKVLSLKEGVAKE